MVFLIDLNSKMGTNEEQVSTGPNGKCENIFFSD
jgi:hypothetical protein